MEEHVQVVRKQGVEKGILVLEPERKGKINKISLWRSSMNPLLTKCYQGAKFQVSTVK